MSLERQLYTQLRDAILSGKIRPGARLPSTRGIAAELQCSRNTVVSAVGLVLAEGYLVGKHGSGTFVSPVLPEELMRARISATPDHRSHPAAQSELSRRGEAMARMAEPRPLKNRPFDIGIPDVELIPFRLWGKLLIQYWQKPRHELLAYGAPGGYLPLREQISEYLREARGVHSVPEQIFVTTGAQQAFDCLARVLLDPGDGACVEDPGYIGTRGALAAAGARVMPVRVDKEGISIEQAMRGRMRIRVCAVTPSHQFPLGVVMSLKRRLELLDWAESTNAWIIEDDYDSEFRYSGPPLTSLQGLSAAPSNGKGRVIYVGSFSKVLFPGLRLGYMVLPSQIVDKFARARRILDSQHPSTVQPVLAEFLRQGHFVTHVRRMRRIYERRQKILLQLVGNSLGDLLDIQPHDAGLHLIADFKPKLRQLMTDKTAALHASNRGIYPKALSDFYAGKPERPALLLGYAGMSEIELRKATEKLCDALIAAPTANPG